MKTELTIHQLLDIAAEKSPESIAIVDDRTMLTFADWQRLSLHLAKGLQGMGVKKGDIVGAYVGKNVLFPCIFTAVSRVGGLFMVLDPKWPEMVFQRTFGRWRRRFIITEEEQKHSPGCLSIETWVVNTDNILSGSEVPYSLPEVKPDDIVYLNITSGSTGIPKCAATSHKNLVVNTKGVCRALKLTRKDVHMSLFGMIGHPHELFMRGLFLRGKTVLSESPYPRTILQIMSHHKVTTLMGLAPQLENLARLFSRSDVNSGEVRFVEAGGMHLSDDFIRRFEDRTGVPLFTVWGSTETSGVVLIGEPGREGFSKVVDGYTIQIREPEEKLSDTDNAGEMWISGKGVVGEYLGDRFSTTENFQEGWYRTGDIFRSEEDRFYFLGRRGGLIKSAGLKVYPLEVELALLKHHDIIDVCVVGAVHPARGEVPAAYIVQRPGKSLFPAALRIYLRSILSQHKIPKIYHFVSGLPRTPNGKIDRKAVGKVEVLPDYRGELLRTDVELIRLLNFRAKLFESIGGGFDATWVQDQVENVLGHNPGPLSDSLAEEMIRFIISTFGKR